MRENITRSWIIYKNKQKNWLTLIKIWHSIRKWYISQLKCWFSPKTITGRIVSYIGVGDGCWRPNLALTSNISHKNLILTYWWLMLVPPTLFIDSENLYRTWNQNKFHVFNITYQIKCIVERLMISFLIQKNRLKWLMKRFHPRHGFKILEFV